MYTVGVKRRFLPGYRKFGVTHHENEYLNNNVRLVLSCTDNSVVTVPNIDQRGVKLYPDYYYAVSQKQRNEAAREGLREEIRHEVGQQLRPAPQPMPPIPIQNQRG